MRNLWDAVLRAAGPREFSALVNDEVVRLPRELRGLVGVDRGERQGIYFEWQAMLGLIAVLRPGMTAFDVGCSYGILTCLISRMVGEAGFVHAFEANSEVVEWTARTIQLNAIESRVRLTCCCVGESSGGEVEFFRVPGAGSVASTRNAEILKFHAAAESEPIPLLSLDDYCATIERAPDCLKIDVEGSECLVLRGARRLLERHRPALVLETHGLEINGLGGDVGEVCGMLDAAGYVLMDLTRREFVTAAVYARRYERSIGYLLAWELDKMLSPVTR
ncbi:MAG TPA: FkbM family methyltransferase [Bryobacteraceae bacterium]|nr:FkbM family methyltransferase [Bryobacteraceae bacterium]